MPPPGAPLPSFSYSVFFCNDPATTEIYTLSLHDALPIRPSVAPSSQAILACGRSCDGLSRKARSEEHTSELRSHHDLVCRLLLEKKNSVEEQNDVAEQGSGALPERKREFPE